jgi:8-oxo-dGTP pyrophosphatase MutT (NUDIX family)
MVNALENGELGGKTSFRLVALCIICRQNTFLVTEIIDPQNGHILHRPPGGGIEPGESAEDAVRRELWEELNVRLKNLKCIGTVEYSWFYKGNETVERASLFWANAADDPRLSRGETPDLREADGQCLRTFWRPFDEGHKPYPPVCPPMLLEYLRQFRQSITQAM